MATYVRIPTTMRLTWPLALLEGQTGSATAVLLDQRGYTMRGRRFSWRNGGYQVRYTFGSETVVEPFHTMPLITLTDGAARLTVVDSASGVRVSVAWTIHDVPTPNPTASQVVLNVPLRVDLGGVATATARVLDQFGVGMAGRLLNWQALEPSIAFGAEILSEPLHSRQILGKVADGSVGLTVADLGSGLSASGVIAVVAPSPAPPGGTILPFVDIDLSQIASVADLYSTGRRYYAPGQGGYVQGRAGFQTQDPGTEQFLSFGPGGMRATFPDRVADTPFAPYLSHDEKGYCADFTIGTNYRWPDTDIKDLWIEGLYEFMPGMNLHCLECYPPASPSGGIISTAGWKFLFGLVSAPNVGRFDAVLHADSLTSDITRHSWPSCLTHSSGSWTKQNSPPPTPRGVLAGRGVPRVFRAHWRITQAFAYDASRARWVGDGISGIEWDGVARSVFRDLVTSKDSVGNLITAPGPQYFYGIGIWRNRNQGPVGQAEWADCKRIRAWRVDPGWGW